MNDKQRTKARAVCSRCGEMLLAEQGRLVCYNDQCELNREALAARETVETFGAVMGFTWLVVRWGLAVTALALFIRWVVSL